MSLSTGLIVASCITLYCCYRSKTSSAVAEKPRDAQHYLEMSLRIKTEDSALCFSSFVIFFFADACVGLNWLLASF